MSKKNKKTKTAPVQKQAVVETESVNEAGLQSEVQSQPEVQAKPVKTEKVKKAEKKEKKPNFFVRIGKKIGKKTKEIFSELKKVTWPTFPTVLKQTGVVIVVVAFFLLVIFGFDSLLSVFYQMLIK